MLPEVIDSPLETDRFVPHLTLLKPRQMPFPTLARITDFELPARFDELDCPLSLHPDVFR
jgi:hypothetical protein